MKEPKEDIRAKIYRENAEGPKPRNKAFQQHFKDFTPVRTVNENGKVRIKHIYTGEYYCQNLNGKQRILLRIVMSVSWLFAVVIFLVCASVNLEINRKWYVVLGQAGALTSLGWCAYRLFLYLTAPAKMTVGDWHSGPRGVKRSSLCCAGFLLLTAVLTVISTISSSSNWGNGLLCSLGYIICSGIMFLANRLETKVCYTKIPSEYDC